jgi:hypothetical protein
MLGAIDDVRDALLKHRWITYSVLGLMMTLFFSGAEFGSDLVMYITITIFAVCIGILINIFSYVLLLVFAIWSSALFMVMFVMSGPLALAVGPELAVAAGFTYITAEACPPGRWSVIQVPELDRQEDRQQILQHSLIYESQNSLRLIRDWLAERMHRVPV